MDDADNPADKKKGNLPAVASHLHAIFLDADTGQKQDQRDWPSTSFYASLHAVGRAPQLYEMRSDCFRVSLRRFESNHLPVPIHVFNFKCP